MHEDQLKEGFIDIASHFRGAGRGGCPVVGEDATFDGRGKMEDGWGGVGFEEAGVDLGKDVPDGLCFFRKFDAKVRFELEDEVLDDFGA